MSSVAACSNADAEEGRQKNEMGAEAVLVRNE